MHEEDQNGRARNHTKTVDEKIGKNYKSLTLVSTCCSLHGTSTTGLGLGLRCEALAEEQQQQERGHLLLSVQSLLFAVEKPAPPEEQQGFIVKTVSLNPADVNELM